MTRVWGEVLSFERFKCKFQAIQDSRTEVLMSGSDVKANSRGIWMAFNLARLIVKPYSHQT